MRAVVDTNTWVSAMLNVAGAPARVLTAFREQRFTNVTSREHLGEIDDVLSRPRLVRRYGITPAKRSQLLLALQAGSVVVPITGTVHLCRDPDDDMIIETALVGRADVLVSRDEDLTRDLGLIAELEARGVRVVTVRRFLELLDNP